MSPKDDASTLAKIKDRLSAVTATLLPPTTAWPFNFPDFDQLPEVNNQPQGCLWGYFDRAEKKDELGTINLLTPSVVQAAAQEIRTGERVQLDRVLHPGQSLSLGRRALEQTIVDFSAKSSTIGFDDILTFNTQGSTQWDGLKHYAHQKTKMYYNDLSHHEAKQSTRNGTHNWGDAGGIVGRGILVDWVRWHEQTRGPVPAAYTRHEIPVADVINTLNYQGTRTKPGDILVIRSGYGRWLDSITTQGSSAQSTMIGLKASEETVRWLYGQHFAAVAGDSVTFEAWPPHEGAWRLHEWLIAQWGTPIGELFDLEKLSELCEARGSWEFFLTSAPLRVKGGIGSPAGVIAIM